jgi:hypothetical protein
MLCFFWGNIWRLTDFSFLLIKEQSLKSRKKNYILIIEVVTLRGIDDPHFTREYLFFKAL